MHWKFVCLSVCLYVICHTHMAPSVLHGRRHRLRHLSPWALPTPTLPPHQLWAAWGQGVRLPRNRVDSPIQREIF